jgi:plasmid maintenance system antidote protein VapI
VNTKLKLAIIESRAAQYTVAALAEINETRLSRIILGRIEATDAEKARLARVLGLTVDELFGLNGSKSPPTAKS